MKKIIFLLLIILSVTIVAGCSRKELTKSPQRLFNIVCDSGSIEPETGTYVFETIPKRSVRSASFRIENNGSAALILNGDPAVIVTGTDFTIEDQPLATIDPGSFTGFNVAFNPSVIDEVSETVTITSNDPVVPEYTFTLTGEGISNELAENRSVYEDDDLTVLQVAFTIGNGTSSDTTFTTWQQKCEDFSTYYFTDFAYLYPEPDPIIITFSDDYGFSQTAELRLRGASSRFAVQKSFKVEFSDKSNLWRNQNNLNFLKHAYDFTRLRNKLSFDLFEEIPNFTSLRTQFVHITINGEGYGLFELIENCDRLFLTNHGLDPNGHIYKAKDFSFSLYNLTMLQAAIDANDTAAFETYLEPKGNAPDNEKLFRMIEDIDNDENDIDEMIDKYFNRENFLTWMAINILTRNLDTINQNFYLYNPSDSTVWYFLPWDYDGAWGWEEQPDNLIAGESIYYGRAHLGLANWWSSSLQKRFFQKSTNITELNTKITYLRNTFFKDDDKITELMDSYKDIIIYFLNDISGEDNPYLPISLPFTDYDIEFNRVRDSFISSNYTSYFNNLENPMPVWSGMETVGSDIAFYWDESYDLQGDAITYTFQLATSPFDDYLDSVPDSSNPDLVPGTEQAGLTDVYHSMLNTSLIPDEYWWRVLIIDEHGNWQIPFTEYWDETAERQLFGMFYFNKIANDNIQDEWGNQL